MCGIAGEITTGAPPDVSAVVRMVAALEPRGPDGTGLWSQGRVCLGHRRLKIIDLSERGAQPMVDSELGLALAFNGCIYNYRELRRELERAGYAFFSTSDTEVVLKAYHHWGQPCVERFLGMFAFVVAERDSGRVVLARDRLGIKPLYLADRGSTLRFASTLPALLKAGGIDTAIDRVALHHFLTFHSVVPAPRTILAGVRKLPPATVMTLAPDGGRSSWCYWQPSFARDPTRALWSSEDWADAVLEALRTAVARRAIADVPVGVLLSGGVDSSVIVALLAEQAPSDLKTFSVGFPTVGERVGNEFEYSDLVAREFDTDHRRIEIDDTRLLPALGEAIVGMSEPMISHDAVAFHLLSEEVRKEVKVVQSGQGADEVFAGYSWYPPLAGVDGTGSDVYAAQFFDRSSQRIRELLRPPYRLGDDPSRAFVDAHFAAGDADEPVDRALRLDSEVMLVEDPVKRLDNMTMAFGLEARVPFLDHELVELAASCPPQLKLAHDGKGVLKDAARRVIPAAVIDRPKGYFPVPALRDLRGPYVALVREALGSDAARERGLFEPAEVERLLEDPNSDRATLGGNTLWHLGLLELWLQAHDIAPAGAV